GELRPGDGNLPDGRTQPVRREERQALLAGGNGGAPRLGIHRGARERVAVVLLSGPLHERTGAAGVRLELERRSLAVAERGELLLDPTDCPAVDRRRVRRQ